MQPEIFKRIMRFKGKTRREVSNPCITANDAIELANYIGGIMTLDELRQEAEKFYEWPSDTKDHVTLTSSLIFAQLMIQRTQKALERPAPCLNFCEATAFKIEIRKLKAANEKASYLVGAFERGADANEYAIDIADFRNT